MNRPPAFSLVDIARWPHSGAVNLPNVQRGFVWKASQIENLWDSILRGYPLGAFVLVANADGRYDLLDGQQRATAICLGFGARTFRGTQDRIRVFIDLTAPDAGDTRRYIVRAITRSHPWGYQRKDNTKPLDADSIRRAMNLYAIADHLDTPLERFFPYDAGLPVPLDYFIHADSVDALLAAIDQWPAWPTIATHWQERHGSAPLEACRARLETIFARVRQALDDDAGPRIPALYLDRQLLADDAPDTAPAPAADEDDEAADEVENLFVRLNAGGTPLRGEELNYSILKAHIQPDLQARIEAACRGFIDPARFITLAFRLFQQQASHTGRDAILMRIKPKQFQKHIAEKRGEFIGFIKGLLDDQPFGGRSLLAHARHLLSCGPGRPFGLPYPIVARLADSAPEVIFMLLYRLQVQHDEIADGGPLHRRVLGLVTLFLWFGKGERQRDRAKLLSNIWPCARTLGSERFWSASTVRRAMLDGVLAPFPHPADLAPLADTDKLRANNGLLSGFVRKHAAGDATHKAFLNRDLILYAQRDFLATAFREAHFEQDDTNVPFDWDHLSPNRLIARKRGIPKAVREWYNTNGNLRAWPYSLNRIDQDGPPARKLDPLNPAHFGDDDPDGPARVKAAWQAHFGNDGERLTRQRLARRLLAWSFCDKDWAACSADNLKNRDAWRTVCDLIIRRNLALYAHWFETLEIDALIPAGRRANLAGALRTGAWMHNPRALKDAFDDEDYDFWVSAQPVAGSQAHLYLGHPRVDRDSEADLLAEDAIVLGLFEKAPGGLIERTRIPEDQQPHYPKYGHNYIEGAFTLVSDDPESVRRLLRDMHAWLAHFPGPEAPHLAGAFAALLRTSAAG